MKFDGNMVTVAEAVVGDETGITKLVFRNGMIVFFTLFRDCRLGQRGYYHYNFECSRKNIE